MIEHYPTLALPLGVKVYPQVGLPRHPHPNRRRHHTPADR